MKYKWILFDADNTLFNFTYSHQMALKYTFYNFDIPFHDDLYSVFAKLNTKIWQAYDENKISHEEIKTERFKILFNEIGVKNIDLIKFNINFIENLIKYSKLFDGTEDFIKELFGEIKMAIITNGMKEVQRPRFDKCTIKSHFDHIFISGEMGTSKPNKEYFNIAHKKTGMLDKSEYLVVGDNILADIEGGKSYGFDTCWFNPSGIESKKSKYADFEIKSIRELKHKGII